jgi:hypothetical protein
MPTFDAGHYFLTALVPVRTDEIKDDTAFTSPVHALRKRLDLMPTAAQTPACGGGQSPFAGNTRNHFVRLAIIDDVAYNGREQRNSLLTAAFRENPSAPQTQDHLSCPFLLFAAEFDAESGTDGERDSYLTALWATMADDLRGIFRFCRGFETRVKDASSFCAYIADCQIETTMPFNDYYIDPLDLPEWPANAYKWSAIVSGGALAIGLLATLMLLVAELFTRALAPELRYSVGLVVIATIALAVVAAAAYASLMRAGAKPFRSAPDSTLPIVLKSLHLQGAFTQFAIGNQMLTVSADPNAAQELYDGFAAFVAANRPDDPDNPTQAPGVIGV